jgi:hypothetical protein
MGYKVGDMVFLVVVDPTGYSDEIDYLGKLYRISNIELSVGTDRKAPKDSQLISLDTRRGFSRVFYPFQLVLANDLSKLERIVYGISDEC